MGTLARWHSPFMVLHEDEDGTGTAGGGLGDVVNLLDMVGLDGDIGFILWRRIGDNGGLHVRPHSPRGRFC